MERITLSLTGGPKTGRVDSWVWAGGDGTWYLVKRHGCLIAACRTERELEATQGIKLADCTPVVRSPRPAP